MNIVIDVCDQTLRRKLEKLVAKYPQAQWLFKEGISSHLNTLEVPLDGLMVVRREDELVPTVPTLPNPVYLIAGDRYRLSNFCYDFFSSVRSSDREIQNTLEAFLQKTKTFTATTSKSMARVDTLDPVLGIPYLPYYLQRLSFQAPHAIMVVGIGLESLLPIENFMGSGSLDLVLRQISRALENHFRPYDGEIARGEDMFIYVFLPHAHEEAVIASLPKLKASLEKITLSYLPGEWATFPIDLPIRHTVLHFSPSLGLVRQVYQALYFLKEQGKWMKDKVLQEEREEVLHLIRSGAFQMFAQPIFNLSNMTIVGYEFFNRPKQSKRFRSAEFFFQAASRLGLAWELERYCFQRLKDFLNNFNSHFKLFINLEPSVFLSLPYRDDGLFKPLEPYYDRLVLEITERASYYPYSAAKTARKYIQDMGMQLAIDDVGSGTSNLKAIAELQPEYMKISMVLTQKIQKDPLKGKVVKILGELGKGIASQVIAEGIEEDQQITFIRDLSIPLGQGYALEKPRQLEERKA